MRLTTTPERIAADIVDMFAQATAKDWSRNDHRLYVLIRDALKRAIVEDGTR